MSDDQILLDNTPHPRILRALGEIKFAPWQCIAELIDNSIDGFLDMRRRGISIPSPEIYIALGRDTVTVKDNGSGMSLAMLEKAVRAGFTSQEEVDSLGLYGMGFNIATAVLGSLTTIWTTRAGDAEWYGTEIDLVRQAQTGVYGLPRKQRGKSDHTESGTQIVITRIKPEHRDNLINKTWVRTNIAERLSKVYSTMLRDRSPQPLGFKLILNTRKLQAKEHCVWPSDWSVYRHRDGTINPFQEFNENFGTRYRNRLTGEMLDSPDGISPEEVIEIPQRVYGWIGVQRYTDEKEYGFDLIRNGRKIEIDSKAFFTWEDTEGNEILEYPIDDKRGRAGRIVGEVHLDHGYVYYTKDHFERNHRSWQHLDRAIRGAESLTHREPLGFSGTNDSPLGIIQRTFRRNSPYSPSGQTWGEILCFKENDVAKQWADEWRKGTAEFRDDTRWRDKLKSYDAPPSDQDDSMSGDDMDSPSLGDDPILGGGTTSSIGADEIESDSSDDLSSTNDGRNDVDNVEGNGNTSSGPGGMETAHVRSVPRPLNGLNLRITGIGLRGATYDVEAFEEDQAPSGLFSPPWRIQPTARGVYEFYVNAKHSVFDSTTLQVRDAVLAEMAHIITNEEGVQATSNQDISFAEVLVSLRERFSSTDSLDMTQLTRDIEDVRTRIASMLTTAFNETERRAIVDKLTPAAVEEVELDAANGRANTPLTDYLRMDHLSYLMDNEAKALFDAGCFNRQWTPERLVNIPNVLEAHRVRLVRALQPLLLTLSEFKRAATPDYSREYLFYVRASVNRLQEFLSGGIG